VSILEVTIILELMGAGFHQTIYNLKRLIIYTRQWVAWGNPMPITQSITLKTREDHHSKIHPELGLPAIGQGPKEVSAKEAGTKDAHLLVNVVPLGKRYLPHLQS
jgi:hypothetical protein